MKLIIQKWKKGLGLYIPKRKAKKLELKPGNTLNLEIKEGQMDIRPSEYSLKDLLKNITPENSHTLSFEEES